MTTEPVARIWSWRLGDWRVIYDVLPDLADWHRPGCCRPSCPAADRGRDPAECALRLTGTCADCGCEPPVRVHG